jgi:hypothetical protein
MWYDNIEFNDRYQRIIKVNTPKTVVIGKKLNKVYDNVQYLVQCFYQNTFNDMPCIINNMFKIIVLWQY